MPPKQRASAAAKAAPSARPKGTDGSDGKYRMVIENKYKQLAQERKTFKLALLLHTLYVLVLAAWTLYPLYKGVDVGSQSVLAISFGALGAPA
eukprot:scaffold8008_cov430-Prasinococcus_capsulatus_cf.AAC.12